MAHLAMNSRFSLVDFDEENGLAVGGRFQTQRTHFLTGCFIALRQQGHRSCGGTSEHLHSPIGVRFHCCCRRPAVHKKRARQPRVP